MKQEFIQFAPLFAGLAEDEQALLDEGFVQGQLAAGAALFQTGSQSDGLYLIGKGHVRLVTPAGTSLATLGSGSVLGEDSLFRSLPYDVSANAVSDLEYWKLGDRKLRDLILQRPAIGLQLSRNFGSLIAQMQDYLVQRLAQTPELNGLPRHALQSVADHLQPRRLASGQYLYRVGDAPSGLYLVESGEIEAQDEGGSERQTVRAGSLLGAIAVLTNKPNTGSAVATEDTMLWALAMDDFVAVNSRQPGLRRSLGRNVRARLSRADQVQAGQRLSKMPVFAELPAQIIQAITQRMVLQHFPAGERVYRIGEGGDAMYLIESGEIELTAENASGVVEEIGRIGAEGFFGEMSLVTGQVRTEDATATRNTNLWILFKVDLDTLTTQYPAIGKAISQGVAARLASSGQDELHLRQFALFADLGPADLKQVAAFLRPMRYRAGEQIYRVSAPADNLYLLDKGQVRVQTVGGGGYVLGPGETFGERALLTSQPHNSSVMAETDVDLWTISKADFDMLLNRFPVLAISMSRLLSQRLGQVTTPATAPTGVSAPPPAYLPSSTATASTLPSARRRQAATAGELEPTGRQRQGFGAWYSNLSGFGKLRFVLLVLLVILLLCVTVPFTVIAIMNGPGAATRAAAATLNRALSAVYAEGSYEVATASGSRAERLRAADAQVPATPTYTPFPTDTPQPTNTPLPTDTPTPAPTATAVEVIVYDAAAAPAPEEPTATPEPMQAAAPALARAWDARLDALGISVEDAQVGAGQPYWRVIEGRWEDEVQAGGKHHIYVEVLDENGKRVVGQPVTVFWGDGNHTGPIEDKPAPDLGFNYQMYASGYAYNVRVEGLPSEIVHGPGMGDLANRFKGIHTAYYFVYQKAIK